MQLKKYILNWKKWIFFKKKYLFIWALFLFVLIFSYNLTQIKNIYCYCDGQICQDDNCQNIHKLIGKNLLSLNKKRVIDKLNQSGKYQKITISTKSVNTVVVDFHSTVDFFIFNSTITPEQLKLSLDSPPVSSDSAAVFNKPSLEISEWLKSNPFLSLKIYPNGFYEITSTASSQIFAITKDKKDTIWYKKAFKLIKTVLSYADVSGVYFLDNNVYFAQVGQPDIIVSIDYQEEKLLKSLQSMRFLTTIKKDPKIIDLRYTNPIIR